MASKEDETDRHEAGRIIGFSDGVVAIAITLLILPLADIQLPKSGSEGADNPLGYIWQENATVLTSFLITWAIIVIFWFVHHRLFGRIQYVNDSILKWNILWLFGIVILPFPQSLLEQANFGSVSGFASREVVVFYIGTMFVISLCLSMISMQMRKYPELLTPAAQERGPAPLAVNWSVTTYFGILILVALAVPQVALYGLIGLAFIRPATDAITRMPKPGPDKPPTEEAS